MASGLWNCLKHLCQKTVTVKTCVLQQFAIKSVFMEADVYSPTYVLAALSILGLNVKRK